MAVRFNAPPGWPVPPESWAPHDDWMPDPSWPTPPRGWTFWTVGEPAGEASAPTGVTAYGTDRGSWLASLRARAASGAPQPVAAAETDGVDAEPPDETEGAEWALDGLLSSAGRLEA